MFCNLRFYRNIRLKYLNKVEQKINTIQRYREYLRDTMLWRRRIIFFRNILISTCATMPAVSSKETRDTRNTWFPRSFIYSSFLYPTGGRSLYPELKDGGALQISLVKFQIDYYPYHLAMADRKHWAKYKENATPHSQWLQQSLSSFRTQFMDLIDSSRTQHSPLTRSQGNVTGSCAI